MIKLCQCSWAFNKKKAKQVYTLYRKFSFKRLHRHLIFYSSAFPPFCQCIADPEREVSVCLTEECGKKEKYFHSLVRRHGLLNPRQKRQEHPETWQRTRTKARKQTKLRKETFTCNYFASCLATRLVFFFFVFFSVSLQFHCYIGTKSVQVHNICRFW